MNIFTAGSGAVDLLGVEEKFVRASQPCSSSSDASPTCDGIGSYPFGRCDVLFMLRVEG
jgi:hypothetical protein